MNLPLLYQEKKFVNHQFPTITVKDNPPTIYEGMLRCDKGDVKDLAEKNIWPFTEYVSWHRFKLILLPDYPLSPPSATWLSDIAHPNIVSNIPGAVCVSILGEGWRPDLKLVSVINALYYLLSDPNPDNVFDSSKCLEAAKVCRKHGFPKFKSKDKQQKEDIMHFNIIPIPNQERRSHTSSEDEILRFRISGSGK